VVVEPGWSLTRDLGYRFYMHYAEGSLMALIGSGALKNGELLSPYTEHTRWLRKGTA
jgi:hypothetical protein